MFNYEYGKLFRNTFAVSLCFGFFLRYSLVLCFVSCFYLIFFYLLPCGFLVIQGTPFIQLGTFQYILIDFWRFVMFLLRSQHILLYLPFT